MDEGASVRLKEDEIKKLKAARARDAERTKTAALKNKTKALADQKRAHDLNAAELRKEVEDLKICMSSHRKDEGRWGRKVAHLEGQLAESVRACEQGCIDLKWLRTEHEEVQRKLAILKKERNGLKLEVTWRYMSSPGHRQNEGAAPRQVQRAHRPSGGVEGQHVG